MFSPSLELLNIIPFHSLTTNIDNNMETDLEKFNYDFPIKEPLLKESYLEDDIFNRNALFSDDYSSIMSYSLFDIHSNSISLDEDYEQRHLFKIENKIEKAQNNKNSEKKEKCNISNDNQKSSHNHHIQKSDKLLCNNSKEKEKLIFGVVYPEKNSIFTKNKDKFKINNYYSDDDTKKKLKLFKSTKRAMIKIRRTHKIQRRMENRDNIRRKIKRGFFNSNLIKKLNDILKSIGSRLFFEKFPQNFVTDVVKQSNKELINLTIYEIFEKKELYKEEDYPHYYHNLKVIKNEEIKKNIVMRKILDKKYYELFDEYINSNEFKIEEINRLKRNGMDEEYIKIFIFLSKHFIDFFQN